MSGAYGTLFSLSILHGYDEGVYSDYEAVWPEETTRTFARGRLLTRSFSGVFHVLYLKDAEGNPVFPVDGLRVVLGVCPTDPCFANYTALGSSMRASFRYYRNGADSLSLDAYESRKLVGSMVSHALSSSERPLVVSLVDADGDAIAEKTVTEAMRAETVSFELASDALGRYSVVEKKDGVSVASTLYFVSPDLVRKGAIAAIEVTLDSTFTSPGGAPHFTVSYAAREEVLSYYLVSNATTDDELLALNVSDQGYAEEGRSEVTFDSLLDSAFGPNTELPVSLLGSSGARVRLFRSQAPVARRRRARKKIELSRNGEVLIENLPQPGADRADANLVIHLVK